jgi:hypothetical protein
MPRYVHVPTDATAHLIRQAYEAGGAFQWAREGWRNSEESGATKIYFDVERQAAEKLGVLRRAIIDNGSGMSPDDMRVFLTTFGGGGKPIGVDGNFGQGFKSSVLPWNPYGVVVISYTEDTPDGAMLWIFRDHEGNYALKEWQVVDEYGDVVLLDVIAPMHDEEHGCDWSKIRPDWLATGTVIVLLGDGLRSNTIDGDPQPTRRESTKGLVKYLNGRLFDIPTRDGKNVETTIVDLETVGDRADRRATKDVVLELPDGAQLAIHQRRVHGLKHFIPSSAIRGSVRVDTHGTAVEWYYVPEPDDPVAGSGDYVSQRPVVAVDYQGEAYHADSAKSRYRQFGITDEIMNRTWLIVRPPVYSDARPTQWGVLTQASRNMLIVKGGAELPWEEWGDAFYGSFPPELAAARDAAREKSAAHTDASMAKHLSRILDRLNPRFKASRLVSAAMGKIMGYPTDSRVGAPTARAPRSVTPGLPRIDGATGRSSGERPIVAGAAGGPETATATTVRGGYPTWSWKRFDADEAKFLARFDPKDTSTIDGVTYMGVVVLNAAHPVFVREFDYWATEVWPKADPAKVHELVQRIYGEEAVAHVVHAQQLNGTVVGKSDDGVVIQIGREDVESLLEPPALSAALLGLVNVEQRMLTQGGGLFGTRAAG